MLLLFLYLACKWHNQHLHTYDCDAMVLRSSWQHDIDIFTFVFYKQMWTRCRGNYNWIYRYLCFIEQATSFLKGLLTLFSMPESESCHTSKGLGYASLLCLRKVLITISEDWTFLPWVIDWLHELSRVKENYYGENIHTDRPASRISFCLLIFYSN